jgi:HPt (histidine-containing phosphotransfer) domain-containing protein
MTETREQKMAAARVRLAELSARFVARSRDDLATLRDALGRLATGDGAALAEIRHLAHRMSGTGATLGFAQVSECAARIEKIAEAQTPGSVPETFALAQITGAVEALSAHIEALARA